MPTVGLLLLIGGALLIYEAARSLGASVGTTPTTPAGSSQQSNTTLPPLQSVPGSIGPANPGSGGASAYSPQVQSAIQTALARFGLPSSWVQPLLFIQSKESGGYPYEQALSVTPPNKIVGQSDTPTGLFQVKVATYQQLIPSLTPDCRDPAQIVNAVCNTEAAIMHIMTAWGGSPLNIPGVGNGQPYTNGY